MRWRDVLRMTIYVTDMDAALGAYGEITARLASGGATPPATIVEVSRLAIPGMAVEIDVSAGR
jgi:enamine deaminase RidA (YjgF/YER057c/UK114 family)